MSYDNDLGRNRSEAEVTNRDPYGDYTPGDQLTSAQKDNAFWRSQRRSDPPPTRNGSDNDWGWFVVLAVLPWLCLLLVGLYWAGVVPGIARPLHAVLLAVFPDGWVGAVGQGRGRPELVTGVVAAVVVALVVALLVVRRVLANRWARGRRPAIVAWLVLLPVSVVVVAVLVVAPGFVLLTGDVAAGGRPGRGDGLRSWPLTLSAVTVVWWAIGSTRRAVRRATRRRYRDWWQAPDGYWYPPEFEWIAPTAAPLPSMPCYPPAPPHLPIPQQFQGTPPFQGP